jgi:hypothetical protein
MKISLVYMDMTAGRFELEAVWRKQRHVEQSAASSAPALSHETTTSERYSCFVRTRSAHAVFLMSRTRPMLSTRTLVTWLLFALALVLPSSAIKFNLSAARFPPAKCIWSAAHNNALVIVTANVSPGENMRVDVEIVDSSPKKNVYLHKRGIVGETRLAITTHSDGEVGVCFRNYLSSGACGLRTSSISLLRSAPLQTPPKRKPQQGFVWWTWMWMLARMPWTTSTQLPPFHPSLTSHPLLQRHSEPGVLIRT